jgi:hypothetical protein
MKEETKEKLLKLMEENHQDINNLLSESIDLRIKLCNVEKRLKKNKFLSRKYL